MMNFREAVKDLYGFEERDALKRPKNAPENDENPIQSFAVSRLMSHLSRQKLGEMIARQPFNDQVQWGHAVGSIRARLSPNGSVSLERMTTDLHGKPLWITKQLYKVKLEEFTGYEDTVANEIYEKVKDLAHEPIDSASREWTGLYNSVRDIARTVASVNPIFVFQEIKKVSENEYNILFNLTGAGTGKVLKKRPSVITPAGIIDLSYDPDRGSIKGVLFTIEVESEGGGWEINIPYFLAEYTPSQPKEEIINTLATALRHL